MAVMQPRENVYISTQIENITESVFVCVFECACVCVCVRACRRLVCATSLLSTVSLLV